MKISVTYENGMIFQHFGHTEQFKIYEVAENAVVRAEVVNTNGSGHGALAEKRKKKLPSVFFFFPHQRKEPTL